MPIIDCRFRREHSEVSWAVWSLVLRAMVLRRDSCSSAFFALMVFEAMFRWLRTEFMPLETVPNALVTAALIWFPLTLPVVDGTTVEPDVPEQELP